MEPKARKFPVRCYDCGKKEVYPNIIPYSLEKLHTNGKLYTLDIPDAKVWQCRNCKSISVSNDFDDQVEEALKKELEKDKK